MNIRQEEEEKEERLFEVKFEEYESDEDINIH